MSEKRGHADGVDPRYGVSDSEAKTMIRAWWAANQLITPILPDISEEQIQKIINDAKESIDSSSMNLKPASPKSEDTVNLRREV